MLAVLFQLILFLTSWMLKCDPKYALIFCATKNSVASFLLIKTLKWHVNLMEYLWLDVAFAWSEETIWEGWTPLQGAHGFWGLQPFVKKPFMNLVFLSFSFDSVVYSIHWFLGLTTVICALWGQYVVVCLQRKDYFGANHIILSTFSGMIIPLLVLSSKIMILFDGLTFSSDKNRRLSSLDKRRHTFCL